MNDSVQIIPLANLALAFIPAFVVVVIARRWSLGHENMLYAISRMLVQLMLIGYLLAYIFDSDSAFVVLAVLTVMVLASSWIALRTVKSRRKSLYTKALYAITLGGGLTLFIIIWGVLTLDPWYWPSYVIPLAGMIFANALNSVSLAADRLAAEIDRTADYIEARNIAFRSSMIPITNSLFAVGLVSLPGMMTGQILSGISPLIAARYQIMVMCMVFGSAGISSACFLKWVRSDFEKPADD
ncbi:MAG: ABC transporter permease [Thermodesulfobacteriota bacterium]